VLSPDSGELYCAPYGGGDVVSVPIKDAPNYTCFSPDDTQTLIEFIKRHKKVRK
jgi:hypothetical protein